MGSAEHPHCFMGINDQGMAAIVKTNGNKDVHVILRGGTHGPNYAKEHVQAALADMRKKRSHDPHASIMIDCSHGNSMKNHMNQPKVVTDICQQLEEGEMGITGVMIESHLKAGKQSSDGKAKADLEYGVSITDACVDWEVSCYVTKYTLHPSDLIRFRRLSRCSTA
jgi:3-deoxy-7-phosphoheptulonate synthase